MSTRKTGPAAELPPHRLTRDLGVPGAPASPWGTHFCQFYRTRQDLLEVLVPYFRSGLEHNEFCMWVTSDPLTAPEAVEAMRAEVPGFDEALCQGQIEIIPYRQWYLQEGRFDRDRVLAGWIAKLEAALARGYDGLRLTGNTFWLEQTLWRDFVDYEDTVNRVIGDHRMIALCTYSLDRCSPLEVVDVVMTHQFALVKQNGTWTLIQPSERRAAAEAVERTNEALVHDLLHAQRYTRSLIEASLDPLVTIEPGGTITDVNATTEQVTGCSRNELIGTEFSAYFTEPKRARAGYELVFREGTVHDYALELRHRDGHTTPVLYNASVYRDDSGRVLGVFAAARDVTAQRAAEAEVLALNADLEVRVRHRTSDLEQASRNMEAFTYSVSHDLRAPLRALSGFSEALLEDYSDSLDDEGRDYARRIADAAQRMAQLIDDLLHLSRVSRAEMHLQRVDLSAEVAEVAEGLRRREPHRRSRFLITPHIRATADPQLVRTVLENLVGNAWKFTSRRAEAVIEFGCLPAPGAEVCCFVRDNGAGFDATYVDKLFQPFQRLHTDRQFPGNGIGLVSARRIVERHGGRTWAEGQVDQGATVYFTLNAGTKDQP